MIREQDVREAIAEMQGQKNPNAQTCIKLAAYYTILDHIIEPERERESQAYNLDQSSYLGAFSDFIEYEGDSDFAKAVNGKDVTHVISVIDELMTTLQVMHPRLYTGVMARL